MSEWTPGVALLAALYDRLTELVSMTAKVNGGTGGNAKPWPRPLTAVDRARERAQLRQHFSLVDEVKAAQARYAAKRGG